MRGIVIAGTHSGSGKTTVTLGIMAALRKKGLLVQPFKAGPDFIDAGLHRLAAERTSRNLDLWMCGQDYVKRCFEKHGSGADFSVVEGVMGLYDGDRNTASLAALLHTPVVLVVDAYGMAESAGAVVKGFVEFGMRNAECGIRFSGVIFNRVASEGHFARLKNSVKDVPVLGYLPRELDFEIQHRHLGLTTVEENPLGKGNLSKLADVVLQHVDIDGLVASAECLLSFPPLQGEGQGGDGVYADRPDHGRSPHPHPGPLPEGEGERKIRIALAYDKAFSFYYEDNLDMLREAGAEIVRFSPLSDRELPANADMVYFGGGYPELYAEALSKNVAMRASVRNWAAMGRPIYAECGGLMYLSKGIHNVEGRLYDMAGVFPFETTMTKKPRLGYREVHVEEDCIVGGKGEILRGHEFHYSEIASVPGESHKDLIYTVRDGQGREKGREGFRYKNTLASYVHIHFGSNPRIVDHLRGVVKGERIA